MHLREKTKCGASKTELQCSELLAESRSVVSFNSVQSCELRSVRQLTSEPGGLPQALEGRGGGGHDVRSSGHRASRWDAHALNT